MAKMKPAGKIAKEMGLARRARTPQALHHFTRFNQVEMLVDAAEAEPEIGFMTRLMMLCSLPRTNPGERLQYKRENGPYKLVMVAGADSKLPYGNIPRLLLAWMCTEAVRTKSPVLNLGSSLSDFMKQLGIYDSGGDPRTRLRNQMERLFKASVTLSYEDKHCSRYISSLVTDRGEFWWDPKRPDEPVFWESRIELGNRLFNEILLAPIPIDLNILQGLKRSTLALDLYMWLTYRTFGRSGKVVISWKQLYRQFGANPSMANDHRTVQNFRAKVLRELLNIKSAWPELIWSTRRGLLILYPSKPAIGPPI